VHPLPSLSLPPGGADYTLCITSAADLTVDNTNALPPFPAPPFPGHQAHSPHAASRWRAGTADISRRARPPRRPDGEPETRRTDYRCQAASELPVKDAGLRYRKPHTLRHTYATLLI